MPAADDRELMVDSAPQFAQEHVILDLKEEPIKDGADIFGSAKMQELHRHLLQQHEQSTRLHLSSSNTILPEVHLPAKLEPSLLKKGSALMLWFLFNSMTLILNKYALNFRSIMLIHIIDTYSLCWTSTIPLL